MARNLTTAFKNEIDADILSPAIFVQFAFQDGNLNLWSGYHEISFNSEIYIGAGNLLGIDRIEESQDLRAISVSFSLNGINSALIASALTANYQGRSATMWFAVLNTSQQIIQSPYELFSGRMDIISFSDNGETADFAVKCESNMIDIRKARERRYTPEDQKIEYPADLGLDFIPKIQDIDVVWG
jgi:hypothetical protein